MLYFDNCAFLCYYAATSVNFLPTFRYNLSVLSSSDDNLKRNPAVQVRRSCVKSVGNEINVARITGVAILLDTY
jgi:hypothetical protein